MSIRKIKKIEMRMRAGTRKEKKQKKRINNIRKLYINI